MSFDTVFNNNKNSIVALPNFYIEDGTHYPLNVILIPKSPFKEAPHVSHVYVMYSLSNKRLEIGLHKQY